MLGTDAKKVALNKPTMHLDRNDDSKTFRAVVLHELGHALGLLHEHQNPEHDINWNKEAVYKAYTGGDISKELVYSQILELPVGEELLVTSYDRESVMHYEVSDDLTDDARGVEANNWLSDGDKAIARKLYSLTR